MPFGMGCWLGRLSPLAMMSMLGVRKPAGSFTYKTLAFLLSRTQLTTLASSVSGPESSSASKLTALPGMSVCQHSHNREGVQQRKERSKGTAQWSKLITLRPKTLAAPNTR